MSGFVKQKIVFLNNFYFSYLINSSHKNTAPHAAVATVNRLLSKSARTTATTSPTAPETGLWVAVIMAGNVIAERVT